MALVTALAASRSSVWYGLVRYQYRTGTVWYFYRIVPVARSRLPGRLLIGPSQIPAYGIMYTLSILLYFVLYMLFHHGADGVTKHQLSPTKSTPATRSNWTRLFFLFCVRFVFTFPSCRFNPNGSFSHRWKPRLLSTAHDRLLDCRAVGRAVEFVFPGQLVVVVLCVCLGRCAAAAAESFLPRQTHQVPLGFLNIISSRLLLSFSITYSSL